MAKYNVYVSWSCGGMMEVEAASKKEAFEMAYDCDSLPSGEYVDNSFVVDIVEEVKEERGN